MNFEPLEIKNAILKELALEIMNTEKGRRFPHPGIEVQLFTPDNSSKNKYQITLADNDGLKEAIHEFLQEPRCAKVAPFLESAFIEESEDANFKRKGYFLRYIPKPPVPDAEYYLEVSEGFANRARMRLVFDETFIGRCQNVVEKGGGIVRINDLYFPDSREVKGKIPKALRDAENINNSVSRMHAHIKNIGGSYFLFDDESSRGTKILPGGRGTAEQVDKVSGKKLGHNDLISFGKAVVKVRVVKK